MGSIPLPALDVKTPEQPDMLQKYGQLLALRNSQSQQQLQQQEAPLRLQQLQQGVQGGQIQLQQAQQGQLDQQALTKAYTEYDPKDPSQLPKLIIKNGGSGAAAQAVQQKLLDQQKAYSETFKNNMQGAKAQVDATKEKGDQLAGGLTPLLDPTKVPDAQLPQALQQTVQGLVQNGTLDPQHAQAALQLVQQAGGDPSKIRMGVDQFIKTNQTLSQLQESAYKAAQTAQEQANTDKIKASTDPTSPLYSPSASAVAMGTAPGAAQIQAGEVKQAARKAGAEAAARQPFELSLAAQRQALSQGDPAAAAKLLVNGDATLSELKARGATPEFIAKTLDAAHQLSNGQYNAQSADAQFQVAKSPENVKFFGSAKSLTDPGGTLDQLDKAGRLIPQSQVKALNSIADWEKAATSNGPLSHYAATALGVADDYAKVMGGGQGSDTSRAQALNLIKENAGPNARAGAIAGIRDAVGSQVNSRIGQNPVLGRMYGDVKPQQAAPPRPAGVPSDAKWNPQGNNGAGSWQK